MACSDAENGLRRPLGCGGVDGHAQIRRDGLSGDGAGGRDSPRSLERLDSGWALPNAPSSRSQARHATDFSFGSIEACLSAQSLQFEQPKLYFLVWQGGVGRKRHERHPRQQSSC